MDSFEFKFNVHTVGHRSKYNIISGVYINNRMHKVPYTLWLMDSKYLKCILVMLKYINLIKTNAWYYFNNALSSFEIMCRALIVLYT